MCYENDSFQKVRTKKRIFLAVDEVSNIEQIMFLGSNFTPHWFVCYPDHLFSPSVKIIRHNSHTLSKKKSPSQCLSQLGPQAPPAAPSSQPACLKLSKQLTIPPEYDDGLADLTCSALRL